jgi:3-hydroxyacyl-[acyl-carrier-protein] dehydratase
MPNALDPNLLEQLKNMIRRDLKLGANTAIADDMQLFGSTDLDLDSLDILLLVTNIEKQLGVRIPNEAVGQAIFKDVATLALYIQSRRGGQAPATSGVVEVPTHGWLDKLPHRDPFRFVTRIIEVQPGKSATGVWILKGNEPFFAGHFPGKPIVPGVLIAEALAQISGLAGPTDAPQEGRLAHVDVRFEQGVAPPVEIMLRATFQRAFGQLQFCEVEASVGSLVIARGSITLQRAGTK